MFSFSKTHWSVPGRVGCPSGVHIIEKLPDAGMAGAKSYTAEIWIELKVKKRKLSRENIFRSQTSLFVVSSWFSFYYSCSRVNLSTKVFNAIPYLIETLFFNHWRIVSFLLKSFRRLEETLYKLHDRVALKSYPVKLVLHQSVAGHYP